MQIDTDTQRRKSEATRRALEPAFRGVRDDRRIQHPAAIPPVVHIESQRLLSLATDRPLTVGANESRRLKNSDFHGVYAGSSSSYFPQIQESYVTRDVREKKARTHATRTRLFKTSGDLPDRGPFRSTRGRHQLVNGAGLLNHPLSSSDSNHTSIAQRLDCNGIESMHGAFERLGHMDEDEFVTEMMSSLNVEREEDNSRVGVTAQLRELFRRVDINARGLVTWEDFGDFISTADDTSVWEDTTIKKYHADVTPPPINFVAEIQGMIYLPGTDQVVIHDTRGKGFQLYNPSTHRVRNASTDKTSHGAIVNAVYTPQGRYIITASTSPVLSFYDVDSLHVRQQIPTECFQTALALHGGSAMPSNVLYSASSDGDVHAWDVSSLTHRQAYFGEKKLGQSASFTDLEVLPANAQLACGSMDGKIYMLDLAVGRVMQTMNGHAKGVSMIKYCSENKYLVSGGIDHRLQVWNPHLEQKVGSLLGHRYQLIGLHVRPDSPEVITADSSGVIKIWDLRKFASVQTIVKELYVKHHTSTSERSMTAMSYIDSHKRIAIAHSSIYFLHPSQAKQGNEDSSAIPRGSNLTQHQDEKDEVNKPLFVSFNSPSRLFVAVTRGHIVSWCAATGSQKRSTPIPLGLEVTSVAMMRDGYSCFVGCEDGSVARLILPTAVIVLRKCLHKSGKEVSSIRLLDSERSVLTTADDGNVIVSNWETLEPKLILNHWRGIQSVRSFRSCHATTVDQCYSVPLSLRSFFMGNEIERLKEAFAEADPNQSGKISLTLLPRVLERAFPTSSSSQVSERDSAAIIDGGKSLTFAMFVEVVKDTLAKTIVQGKGLSQTRIATFDAHPKLGTLVTAASTDDDFCLWNLKNAAVIGERSLNEPKSQLTGSNSDTPACQTISIVRYLHPLPYFVCVEENSPRLSIWSSLAMPPFTTRANSCLLRYTHTHATSTDIRSRNSTFLTEGKLTTSKSPVRKTSTVQDGVAIWTVEWFFDEEDDRRLLCLGDEAGHVQLLDVKPLLRRIEDTKKHRVSTTLASTLPPQLPGVEQTSEGLPATLLQRLHRWPTTTHKNIGVRFVHVDNVESLVQPNANKHVLVVSVDDIGAVKLWSFDGQLLGVLQDDSIPDVRRTCWKLRLDTSELRHDAMARQIEQREDMSINQQGESEVRRPSHPDQKAPTSRLRLFSIGDPSTTSRLTESEQLRQAKVPMRPRGSSAEDKLVAWRHSCYKKTGGVKDHRSLVGSSPPHSDANARNPT